MSILKMKTTYFLFSICMMLSAVGCSAKDLVNAEAEKVLIKGKALNAKIIKSNSTDKINAPMTWSVTLGDIKVVQGSSKAFPKTINVELNARHKDALLNYDQIYVLLLISDGKYNTLYWERVISMACLPDELIDDRYKDSYFPDKWGEENVSCTFLRGYEE